jgi:hypothetical protein
MRRIVLPCIAALAVLTAVALLSTAAAIRGPRLAPLPATRDDAASRALAYRFYEAANAVIASGDPAGLENMLAAEFTDTASAPDAEPDRDALIRRLLTVHATAPEVQLLAETVAIDADLAIVHVRVLEPHRPATGPGLADDWVPWGSVDVFRMAGDRIVERRGPALDPVPATLGSRFRVELDLEPPHLRSLTITRLVLDPGVRHVAPALDGLRLMLAESGTVYIAVPEGSPLAQADALGRPLSAGEHVLPPSRAEVVVTNRGSTPAVLLDVSLVAPAFAEGRPRVPASPSAASVQVEVLASDLLIDVPGRSFVLTLDRLLLAPGDRLDVPKQNGPALLHVEAGEVELHATGDVPWISAGGGERSAAGVEAILASGGGALLSAGASADLRPGARDTMTVLIVALHPHRSATGG